MTGITDLRGEGAQPLQGWLAVTHGAKPSWTVVKVLIGPLGVDGWTSLTQPQSRPESSLGR